MHYIFLVHGMGRYGRMDNGVFKPDQQGWFAETEKALKDSYDTYVKAGLGGGGAFEDKFTLVRVEYDSIFERIRTAWQEQANSWTQLGLPAGIITEVQTVLQQKDQDNFLWTHAADVAMFVTPVIRPAVQMHVTTQILDKLAAVIADPDFDTWSVIAHSLGTAVIHDVMLTLQERSKEKFPDWLPPRSLCMVANVGRALCGEAAAYNAALAPSGPGQPSYYVNCNHLLDPFARLIPYRPPWQATRYRDLSNLAEFLLADEVIDWIQDRTDFGKFAALVPHGFTHYLRQPSVASNLWCSLLARPIADGSAIENAVRTDNQAKLRADLVAELQAKLAPVLAQAQQVENKTVTWFLEALKTWGGA